MVTLNKGPPSNSPCSQVLRFCMVNPLKSLIISTHLILCLPLLLLPSVLSSIIVFSNPAFAHITWPKDESFCWQIIASREQLGWIWSRTDRLILLAIHGLFSHRLQDHNSKAYNFFLSHFQLSYPYTQPQDKDRSGLLLPFPGSSTVAIQDVQSTLTAVLHWRKC